MLTFSGKSNRKCFDINIFTPLRYRVLITIIFMSIVVTAVGIIINLILGLDPYITLAFLISMLFSMIIFYLVKKDQSRNIDLYYYVFWSFVFLSLISSWILAGGIDGSLMILFILVYIGLFLTTNEKRNIVLIISILFIISLILLDYYYPHIIFRFENKSQRVIYLLKAFTVYLVFIHLLLEFLLTQNKFEHKKLELINKRLNNSYDEIKKLNEKLNYSYQELESANAGKDRFISIIAHDLRSPFQGLLGVSKMLNESYEDLSDNERKELLTKLNNLLNNQYKFLEELLLWGRLQRTSINLRIEKFSLKECILSEISHQKEHIDKKKLVVELLRSDDITIKSDRNLISAVLRNVLSNAIKFSPIGQKIEVSALQQKNSCMVIIKDYGIGISEEDLPNLFRVDTKVSRKGTEGEVGTGFGLVICSEIMAKLKGNISIESKEGSGTTVTVLIPLAGV